MNLTLNAARRGARPDRAKCTKSLIPRVWLDKSNGIDASRTLVEFHVLDRPIPDCSHNAKPRPRLWY